ncbi:glutathione ABC transporter substrate-binding protein [Aquibacillus albus]|uniref:Glutathione-binding protein GsiB n=1 Tax=Aquibacillus albus TaxID=1168171 RepID=A0ABS2N5P6_9BACI|nr:glutathione ABC transporter substrate-binding protein [Aquibacillus albus]MBM7573461.1 glutathione transport system substrate-binding protein [Aquibacillus albus]
MRIGNVFRFLMVLFFALIIVGCSSDTEVADGQTDDQGDTTEETTEEEGSNEEEEVKEEMVIAVNENFITMDPHNTGDRNSNAVQSAMLEGLLTEEDGKVVPLLAESFEVNDDATEFTFKLREDVTFHDGAPFNAEAVKINFDRIRNPDNSLRLYSRGFSGIVEIEVIDEFNIKVILESPNSSMLTKFVSASMISPQVIEDGDVTKNPVGTGPYKFTEWVQGDHLTIELFEDYWNEDSATVKKITYMPVPENGSRVAMLKTGEADFIFPVPTQNIEELENDESIVVENSQSTIANYISLNTMKEPFDDVRVRQALNYAIDIDAFINVVMGGLASPLDSNIPNTIRNYQQQDLYSYDPEKAKELLNEAGYEDGFSAEIWGNTNSNTVTGMQFIQQQLSEVGVDLEVMSMEEGTLSERIYGGHSPEEAEVQMWYVSWSSFQSDTDNAIRPILGGMSFPPSGGNSAYYANDEVDDWLVQAYETTDEAIQEELYSNVQSKVYEEAPWIFLASDQNIYGKRENVEGVYVTANGRINVTKAQFK